MPVERDDRRRPDYVIKALNKDTDQRAPIGAGWLKEDGSIYLKFNPFVTIDGGANVVITAFMSDEDGPFERPLGPRGRDPEVDDDRGPRRTRTRVTRRNPRARS